MGLKKKIDWSFVYLKVMVFANLIGSAYLFTLYFVDLVSCGVVGWAIFYAVCVILCIWGMFIFSKMPTKF